MTKILISFILFASLVGVLSASECICAEIYHPVCAAKNGKFRTFPNDCEAGCYGFLTQHDGPCFSKMQKLNACSARCSSQISPVCAEKNGKFKSFINSCFANCSNASVLSNGFCPNNRTLNAVTDFFKKIGKSIKKAFNKTEQWIEDKSSAAANKSKKIWHQIGEKWESCNCEPFNAVVKWAKQTVNKTKELAHLTVTELQIIRHNTIQGFNQFKEKVAKEWNKLKHATINGFKRFANKTKEFFEKVGRFIKNVTIEAADWLIEEGQSLKNRTATWWHKTKAGIENCTCCLVRETEEVLDEIHRAAERALNKTKEKLNQWKNNLRTELIRISSKSKEALARTKTFFQRLWPCICPRTYEPVCVETLEGDQATVLNHCFADCAKNQLKTVSDGTCEEAEED